LQLLPGRVSERVWAFWHPDPNCLLDVAAWHQLLPLWLWLVPLLFVDFLRLVSWPAMDLLLPMLTENAIAIQSAKRIVHQQGQRKAPYQMRRHTAFQLTVCLVSLWE
jgi:hypothetical protein